MILEKKYPRLPVTMKTYDAKMMNHLYENKRALEKFGIFAEIQEAAPTQTIAIVAEEPDIEIIEPPVGVQEPIENVDLTGIESEEDAGDDRMIDDEEEDEHVDESEKETEIMD
ncbi:hypothetical protein Hanom_Chr03g00197161 [Helianthus anomalus]